MSGHLLSSSNQAQSTKSSLVQYDDEAKITAITHAFSSEGEMLRIPSTGGSLRFRGPCSLPNQPLHIPLSQKPSSSISQKPLFSISQKSSSNGVFTRAQHEHVVKKSHRKKLKKSKPPGQRKRKTNVHDTPTSCESQYKVQLLQTQLNGPSSVLGTVHPWLLQDQMHEWGREQKLNGRFLELQAFVALFCGSADRDTVAKLFQDPPTAKETGMYLCLLTDLRQTWKRLSNQQEPTAEQMLAALVWLVRAEHQMIVQWYTQPNHVFQERSPRPESVKPKQIQRHVHHSRTGS